MLRKIEINNKALARFRWDWIIFSSSCRCCNPVSFMSDTWCDVSCWRTEVLWGVCLSSLAQPASDFLPDCLTWKGLRGLKKQKCAESEPQSALLIAAVISSSAGFPCERGPVDVHIPFIFIVFNFVAEELMMKNMCYDHEVRLLKVENISALNVSKRLDSWFPPGGHRKQDFTARLPQQRDGQQGHVTQLCLFKSGLQTLRVLYEISYFLHCVYFAFDPLS